MINKFRGPGRPAAGVSAVSRDAVLRAAFRVFVDLGYDAASTRALAQAAGVSAALLNHLFGGKEALWFEAVDAVYGPLHRQQMSALLLAQWGTQSGASVRQMLKTLLLELLAEPGLLRFLYRDGEQQNRRGAHLREAYLNPLLDQLWVIYGNFAGNRQAGLIDRAAFEVLLLGVPRMLVFPQLVLARHQLLGDPGGLVRIAEQVMDSLFDTVFESQHGRAT
jgi:AcrR family transcriptional regulator